jgi:hypothetical protein
MVILYAGEREVKRGPLTRRAVGPHAPAVPEDDPVNRGQADARAGKFISAVQPLNAPDPPVAALRSDATACARNRPSFCDSPSAVAGRVKRKFPPA